MVGTTCGTITIGWDEPLTRPQCASDYVADLTLQGKSVQRIESSLLQRSDYELTFSGPEIVPGVTYQIDVYAENELGVLSSPTSTLATTEFFC